eukprot:gene25380-11041_t
MGLSPGAAENDDDPPAGAGLEPCIHRAIRSPVHTHMDTRQQTADRPAGCGGGVLDVGRVSARASGLDAQLGSDPQALEPPVAGDGYLDVPLVSEPPVDSDGELDVERGRASDTMLVAKLGNDELTSEPSVGSDGEMDVERGRASGTILDAKLGNDELASEPPVDSDGDLDVARPKKHVLPYIEIEHSMGTPLSEVGLQVWRGACLLADLAFDLGRTGHLQCGSMLELGAGTGLVSVAYAAAANLAGMQPPPTILNPEAAIRALSSSTNTSDPQYTDSQALPEGAQEWSWLEADLQHMAEAKYIFAADCVYDDVLTDGLLRCAAAVMQYASNTSRRAAHGSAAAFVVAMVVDMSFSSSSLAVAVVGSSSSQPSCPTMFVSLEKRYNFTLRDMEETAPAFDFFTRMVHVQEMGSCKAKTGKASSETSHAQSKTGKASSETSHAQSMTGKATSETSHVQSKTGKATWETSHVKSKTGKVISETSHAQSETAKCLESDQSNKSEQEGCLKARQCLEGRGSLEDDEGCKLLYGRRIEVASVPQVLCYERSNDLELDLGVASGVLPLNPLSSHLGSVVFPSVFPFVFPFPVAPQGMLKFATRSCHGPLARPGISGGVLLPHAHSCPLKPGHGLGIQTGGVRPSRLTGAATTEGDWRVPSPTVTTESDDFFEGLLADLSPALDTLVNEREAITPIGIVDLGRLLQDVPLSSVYDSRCVNCCAPMPEATADCPMCGQDPITSQQLVGPVDSDAWKEIAAAEREGTSSSKSVMITLDRRLLDHRSGLATHYERPERLMSLAAKLHAEGLIQRCHVVPGRSATSDELEAVHSSDMVHVLSVASEAIHGTASEAGHGGTPPDAVSGADNGEVAGAEVDIRRYMAADTLLGPHALSTARLSAGSSAELAVAVAEGRAASGMAFIRPPGHHASYDYAESGSIFNNAAVAVRAAQNAGCGNVLLLDWDVHHGKGTQEIFYEDPSVLVISMHRCDPEFFGGAKRNTVEETGSGDGAGFNINIKIDKIEFFGGAERNTVEETGSGDGAGFNINIGWGEGSVGDADYMAAMMQVVLPVGYAFKPDMVIISAGFDAGEGEFLGGCGVSPECFAQMTHLAKSLAPTVMLLEGGYNLDVTARSAAACLKVLLGDQPPALPMDSWTPTQAGVVATMNAMQLDPHPSREEDVANADLSVTRVTEDDNLQDDDVAEEDVANADSSVTSVTVDDSLEDVDDAENGVATDDSRVTSVTEDDSLQEDVDDAEEGVATDASSVASMTVDDSLQDVDDAEDGVATDDSSVTRVTEDEEGTSDSEVAYNYPGLASGDVEFDINNY